MLEACASENEPACRRRSFLGVLLLPRGLWTLSLDLCGARCSPPTVGGGRSSCSPHSSFIAPGRRFRGLVFVDVEWNALIIRYHAWTAFTRERAAKWEKKLRSFRANEQSGFGRRVNARKRAVASARFLHAVQRGTCRV